MPNPAQPGRPAGQDSPTHPDLARGDQAAPGTPGTGENICRACHGTGRIDGRICEECDGTGIVVEGIGGA